MAGLIVVRFMKTEIMPLLTGESMREVDRATIKEIGVPGPVLMENAGRAGFKRIIALLRELRGPSLAGLTGGVLVVAGTGNNGGDGLVVARHLQEEDIPVRVLVAGSPDRMSVDASLNYKILLKSGLKPQIIRSGDPIDDLLKQSDIVVDGLLGTGIKGAPRGVAAEIIKQINASSRPVVALDIPSGVEADTGRVEGEAVRALETVTFGALKIGLVLYPGTVFAGRVRVARIGIPKTVLTEKANGLSATTFEEAADLLPRFAPDAHKGTCGRVLVLGGSPGLTGAPVMAGKAAQTVGAGLTTVAVPGSLVPMIACHLMAVMHAGLPEVEGATLAPASLEGAGHLISAADAVVAGCGASRTAGVEHLVLQLLKEVPVPLVLDADGLNVLTGNNEALADRKCVTVLTPHPGEMSRLTGEPITGIVADPVTSARRFVESTGSVLVLKTARTVVASRNGVWVNCTGNAGMASGGTGDVLAGMIGGFLAQKMAPEEAARLAVFLHGLAGDLSARELTVHSTTAGSVLSFLPRAMRRLLEKSVPPWLGYRFMELEAG